MRNNRLIEASRIRQQQIINKTPLPRALKMLEAISDPIPAVMYLAKLLHAIAEALCSETVNQIRIQCKIWDSNC